MPEETAGPIDGKRVAVGKIELTIPLTCEAAIRGLEADGYTVTGRSSVSIMMSKGNQIKLILPNGDIQDYHSLVSS